MQDLEEKLVSRRRIEGKSCRKLTPGQKLAAGFPLRKTIVDEAKWFKWRLFFEIPPPALPGELRKVMPESDEALDPK